MSAIIYNFDATRRAPATGNTTLRDRIKGQIAQAIMEDYGDWPWPVVKQAIEAAGDRIDRDGTLLDAIEASEQVFLDHRAAEAGKRNLIAQRRQHRREALFRQAARAINGRLHSKGQWLHRHYALLRARRVIERGGTISAALRDALGEGWLG